MAEAQPSDVKKLQDYQEMFGEFDESGDNMVSIADVQEIFSELKQRPTKNDMKNMLAKVDKKKTGYVSFDEFVQMMNTHQAEIERIWRKTFHQFDIDGNGYITPDELDSALKGLGLVLTVEQLDNEFKAVDSNQDGKVSYEEFKKMMENQRV